MKMDDGKLVTIAEFGSSFDAQMAKMTLESNGIKAVVVGEDLLWISPKAGIPKVEVKVLACDAEEAKQIIEAQEQQSQNKGQSGLDREVENG
jgi:hypothetical protein